MGIMLLVSLANHKILGWWNLVPTTVVRFTRRISFLVHLLLLLLLLLLKEELLLIVVNGACVFELRGDLLGWLPDVLRRIKIISADWTQHVLTVANGIRLIRLNHSLSLPAVVCDLLVVHVLLGAATSSP
jgi:hypothetical protein